MKGKNENPKDEQIHNLKVQIIQIKRQAKSLSQQNGILRKKNLDLQENILDIKNNLTLQIQAMNFNKEILQERNQQLISIKRQLQMKYDSLQIRYQTLKYEYGKIPHKLDAFKSSKQIEIQQYKRKIVQQKNQFDTYISTYTNAVQCYKKLQRQNQRLTQLIKRQKNENKKNLADVERQKMTTIDELKKQMTKRAYEMRNKAIQIRKQQLDTSTRMTFLKNNQLNAQLQYQCKNTQKILLQNKNLHKRVKQLQQKVDIHQMVEKQLIKRSVIAKKVVSNFNKQNNKQNTKQVNNTQTKTNKQFPNQQENKQQQYKIISKINNELIDSNKRYTQLQKQFTQFKKNKQKQFEKNKLLKNYCDNIVQIMVKYYDNVVKNNIQVCQYQIDLQNLKNKDVQKWTNQQIQKVIKIILNLLRPYLSLKYLGLPFFKQKQYVNKLNYEEFRQKKSSKHYENLKRKKYNSLQKFDKFRSLTNPKTSQSRQKTTKITNNINPNFKSQNNQSIAHRFLKKKINNY